MATSVLVIDKAVSGNTGGTFNDPTNPNNPLNGLKQAKIGDTLTYSLHYTRRRAAPQRGHHGPDPAGLAVRRRQRHGRHQLQPPAVYDSTTRTITWNQPDPTAALPDPADGTLTFKVKVLAAAAEIGIVLNVATIDSDETPEDSGEAPVGVLPPPEALTPPPTTPSRRRRQRATRASP